MQSKRTFLMAVLLGRAAFTQTSGADLRSRIMDVHYPALAEAARIQGDVHLKLADGVVRVLSGHPLLTQIASEIAKLIHGKADVDVTFHFILVDTTTSVPRWVTVKRGNTFERAILRMFGRKTENVVLDYQCQEGDRPANHFDVSVATIEIWIYGRTRCLQTQATKLVAQR